MNRRKKGNLKLKARAKKANSKLAPPKKNRYVSKAEREKLAIEKTQSSHGKTPSKDQPLNQTQS